MDIAHPVRYINVGPFDVTNPDSTGQKFTLARFRNAGEIILRHTVRTTIGAGTLSFDFLIGSSTVATQGTGTGLTANTWTALTETEFTVAAGNSLDVLVKGDGTLDLAGYTVQIEYVPGSPAEVY